MSTIELLREEIQRNRARLARAEEANNESRVDALTQFLIQQQIELNSLLPPPFAPALAPMAPGN